MNKRPRSQSREDNWKLLYRGYTPAEELLRETLTTTGNGYFGTRGCFETEQASEHHYPGTYLAGLYNKLPSTIHGQEVLNADLVNCPNWLLLQLQCNDEGYQSPLAGELLQYTQTLHMRDAVMSRALVVRDRQGRETSIASRRFASMADAHCGAIEFSLTPLNYSCRMTLRSAIDATVVNDGVKRYRGLANKHLSVLQQGEVDDSAFVTVETTQSHVQIALCCRSMLGCPDNTAISRGFESSPGFAAHCISFDAQRGQTYTLEKLVAIHTSRDADIASPADTARTHVARFTSFARLFKAHQRAWRELWNLADMRIEGDNFAQQAIRLHAYHLLATASPNTVRIDAGIPARGLHGEAYRGHIFWDSLFVLPFYIRRFPDVARAHLLYRYRRLDAARNYARENGCAGAMYPWQTAEDGQEETQVIHYNPVSGKWDPDLSCRQRHVSIAVFYNIWEYYNHTGDMEFLEAYGAEMLIEIARFWTSITHKSDRDGRYHIEGVMGPDEFHEKYEGSDTPGIRDNAYTNTMVVWLLIHAHELLDILPRESRERLCERLAFDESEIALWDEITHLMCLPLTSEGIIEQFDGYMKLRELDWDAYRSRYGDIHRMDRILKAEGDSPDRYKVAKQADALMAFYVIGPDEVLAILKRLGYAVADPAKFLLKNYRFYESRTSHGSTLSKVVHAAISRDMKNQEGLMRWFREALESDIKDTQGGTTLEGIHCGVMAGTLNIVVRVLAGIRFSNGSISIHPALPRHWKRLAFKLFLRGRIYHFRFSGDSVSVEADAGTAQAVTVAISRDVFK